MKKIDQKEGVPKEREEQRRRSGDLVLDEFSEEDNGDLSGGRGFSQHISTYLG